VRYRKEAGREGSRNIEQGNYPICSNRRDCSHMLRCERTNVLRGHIPEKRFRCINAEIGAEKDVGTKDIEKAKIIARQHESKKGISPEEEQE
jgi:hypothetical protein